MTSVLLVEDDPDLIDLAVLCLELGGYEAVAVTTGEEALRVLEERDFDVLLLDIKLPGISGWDVLDHVLTRPERRRPGVVVFSAHVGPAEVKLAQQLGAECYLTKPYEPDQLLEAVEVAAGAAA